MTDDATTNPGTEVTLPENQPASQQASNTITANVSVQFVPMQDDGGVAVAADVPPTKPTSLILTVYGPIRYLGPSDTLQGSYGPIKRGDLLFIFERELESYKGLIAHGHQFEPVPFPTFNVQEPE